MLTFGPDVRIFVGIESADMRGSFGSLAGAARRLGLEPLDGHFYLFFNRRRQLCKMIWFDGSGWCLFSKRLSRGSFEALTVPEGTTRIAIDAATFSSLIAGIELGARRRAWYRQRAA